MCVLDISIINSPAAAEMRIEFNKLQDDSTSLREFKCGRDECEWVSGGEREVKRVMGRLK